MMATAALSLVDVDSAERVVALQHCDQSTSALQTIASAEDLSSDGAFLTHFLLLVYEVRRSHAILLVLTGLDCCSRTRTS